MPKRKTRSSASPWDQQEGWKEVEVGDDFLLGSDEYGFMGLEELDPSAIKGGVGVGAGVGQG